MPPAQLPYDESALLPHAPKTKNASDTEASLYATADMVSLDIVLAARLGQVADAQGVALESVLPDPATREAALSATDPQSDAALALLEAYAKAFAALDPDAAP
jgi:hypothetical protein